MTGTLDKLVFTMSLANKLMREHGLDERGWRFDIDSAKKRLGSCNHTDKVITYSKHFLDETDEIIEDTILHEIAHALVGGGHGHDNVWRHMAMTVGADPTRLTETISKPKPNFLIKCENPSCSRKPQWTRLRLKKDFHARAICPYCGGRLTYYKYRRYGG
jgi:predicted SprT family Zn-dependent metalloprotease